MVDNQDIVINDLKSQMKVMQNQYKKLLTSEPKPQSVFAKQTVIPKKIKKLDFRFENKKKNIERIDVNNLISAVNR